MAETYRLFNCARCHALTRICTHCDRGQRYCSARCARVSRRAQLRVAGVAYQGTERGRCYHAARQQAYLERRAKMTHQGPPISARELPPRVRPVARVLVQPAGHEEVPDARDPETAAAPQGAQTQAETRSAAEPRCAFCGRPCGHFARRAPLRRRGPAQSQRRPRLPVHRWLGG